MSGHPLWRTRDFLEAEAALDPAIVGLEESVSSDMWSVALITGATGFIGAHLVAALLADPRRPLARVIALVRGDDPAGARARIAAAFDRHGLVGADDPRLEVIVGDLGARRLGVDDRIWARLAAEVEVIFHFGSLAHWLVPYTRIVDVDVGSTRALLELATTTRGKTLHYASSLAAWASLAVAEGSTIREGEHLSAPETLPGGYCQAKWVCEAMLREAAARGVATVVHRLGDVKGDRRGGRGNQDDIGYALLRACLRHRIAPALASYRTQYLPIDQVVAAIVGLAREPRARGGVFQLACPSPLPWSAVVERMVHAGHEVRVVDERAWYERLREAGDDPDLARLRAIFRPFAGPAGSAKVRLIDVGARLYSHEHASERSAALLGVSPPEPAPHALIDRYIAATAATI